MMRLCAWQFSVTAFAALLTLGQARAEPHENSAGREIGAACAEIWALNDEAEIKANVNVEKHGLALIATRYEDALEQVLAEVADASLEFDVAQKNLSEAYGPAFNAARDAGLDYSKVNPDDPVAQKQFFAATREGIKVVGLQNVFEEARQRLVNAKAKAYLAITDLRAVYAASQAIKNCGDDQIAYLKDPANGNASGLPPEPGPSPAGVWQYIDKDNFGTKLTINDGTKPDEFSGQAIFYAGYVTWNGTLSVRKQSEGIYSGSMTWEGIPGPIKLKLAPDGKSMSYHSEKGETILTRQK